MSKYNIEKSITSSYVSIKFVEELERYILSIAKDINLAATSEKDDNGKYIFKVYDIYGSETFESVQHYDRSIFPDNIVMISLNYSHWRSNLEEIDVSFNKSKYGTCLNVVTNGKKSRETAIGIVAEIERRIKEHSNYNFIFYGNLSIFPFILFGAMFPILWNGKESSGNPILEGFILLTCIFLIVLWNILKLVSPYTTFHTRGNEKIQEATKWLIRGAVGVAIFGSLSNFIFN